MQPVELIARRRALGLSQDDLAAWFGVTQPTISMWEGGHRKPRDPLDIHLRLCELEDLLAELIEQIAIRLEHAAGVRDTPSVEAVTYYSDADYWAADAWAAEREIPAALHQTATAHAAYEAREDLSIRAVIVTPDRS